MDTLNEKMLSVKEVAAVLGCSRDSVVRLIRRDRLRAVSFPMMGGRGKNVTRRVLESEIRRFLRANS